MAALLSLCCVIPRQSGLEMLALASGALPTHLRQLRDAAPFLRTIVHPDVERICALFDDNDGRDEDDRRRFAALYGADPILDYRVRTAACCDGCARLAWPLLARAWSCAGTCVRPSCFLVVPGVCSHVWLWFLMRVCFFWCVRRIHLSTTASSTRLATSRATLSVRQWRSSANDARCHRKVNCKRLVADGTVEKNR